MNYKLRKIQVVMFGPGRGGKRRGAGRKPSGPRPRVSHAAREDLTGSHPIHVTVRLIDGLPSLRTKDAHRELRRCFAVGCDRFGFRLVEYSVQKNHLHLLVEADDARSLSRGMQGLLIRVAKALNKLWGHVGSIFADRYHSHVLKTPREVRNALVYLFQNARKHGEALRHIIDWFTSAPWFEGWRDLVPTARELAWRVTTRARTWLLSRGWKLHGLIATSELPAGASA